MSRNEMANNYAPPLILRYTDIHSYIFTLTFVSLSVYVPFVFHQFHLAGPSFLPMHIFVLVAGLLFGWRTGIIVGALSPLVSYAISGMPLPQVLPQIIVELSAYGTLAGVLREKFHLRVVWSLLGAMIGGRLALLVAAFAIYYIIGESNSPVGPESGPLFALWAAVKQGWPGIVIQLGSIPVIVFLVERLVMRKMESHYE